MKELCKTGALLCLISEGRVRFTSNFLKLCTTPPPIPPTFVGFAPLIVAKKLKVFLIIKKSTCHYIYLCNIAKFINKIYF